MRMWWLLAAVALAGQEPAKDEDVVFRSDTTLVRVDVQVLDQDNRAVTRLEKEAFILREQGQVGGGQAPYSEKDRQAFANALDRILTRLSR